MAFPRFQEQFALLWLVILQQLSFGAAMKDAPSSGPILTQELESGHFIVRRRLTQVKAAAYCEKKGARLVVLPTLEDAQKLVDAIYKISLPWTNDDDPAQQATEFGMWRRYWIGLAEGGTEGEFSWLRHGGLLMYKDMWYPGQPDHIIAPHVSQNEHCVVLWNPSFHIDAPKHTFNDEPCESKHYAICEKFSGEPVGRAFRHLFRLDDENSSLPYGVTLDDGGGSTFSGSSSFSKKTDKQGDLSVNKKEETKII